MIAFLVRRILQAVAVLLVVAGIAFVMNTFLGDPLTTLLGPNSTAEQRAEVRGQLGLDRPLPVQFVDFIVKSAQGDFGMSYRLGRSVESVIAERLPASIELAVVGTLLALAIGIPAGIVTAIWPSSPFSKLILAGSLLGISVPSFFVAVILIWVFSVNLGWLPSFGRGQLVDVGGWQTGLLTTSGWRAIIMPAFSIAIFQIAMIIRLVRAEMIEVLRTDFIRFNKACGLKDRSVYLTHALRNALMQVITIIGLQFGSILAFAAITETVFQWPGLGFLFLQSVQSADVTMMSAFLMMVALIFVSVNFVIDCLYYVMDPRLRAAGPQGAR
jgi:peptide/nickel transport system permease protein